MSRYKNVLPAGSKVINPSTSDVVVDQELALVRPALCVSSGFGVPSLERLQRAATVKKEDNTGVVSCGSSPFVVFVCFSRAWRRRRIVCVKEKEKKTIRSLVSDVSGSSIHAFQPNKDN